MDSSRFLNNAFLSSYLFNNYTDGMIERRKHSVNNLGKFLAQIEELMKGLYDSTLYLCSCQPTSV